ncbi:AbrB/MazE/SpoVT family DNA-binding domain-containing protein [Salinadaptatus halalkaliphilus]|uniref:AbrB/MazE/SpoVT family DNA-binding domain-containing protein n=1 Tax=Salinadaptatus halalkaliphilus TaxID=2419781 RepID=A0A4S3TMB6_9EURY|nr:AbrB/MazE/SpoVT family DNA-binding domain-containing protein [Salinadaptatus halalkaliphilus]THE65359.1 AbrB/MazE/SpoVT family DNA-binding domain-containing protein [Salinadaptatus halalkaliphilus]
MVDAERRTVGDRGQVTLPKRLRETFDIRGGDEVTIRAEGTKIVIEKPTSREELAEGYRRRSDQQQALTEELTGVSREANRGLGDVPDWEDGDE